MAPLVALALTALMPVPHAVDHYLPFFDNPSLATGANTIEVYNSVWGYLALCTGVAGFSAAAAFQLRTGERFILSCGIVVVAAAMAPVLAIQPLRAVVEHTTRGRFDPAIRIDDTVFACGDRFAVRLADIVSVRAMSGRAGSSVALEVVAPGAGTPARHSCTTNLLDVSAPDIVAEIERRRRPG